MGQGDAGIGRRRDGRGDARHDFKGDPGGREHLGLLAAPAEDEGIAALEAGHDAAAPGFFHDEGVDVVLGEGVVPAFFSDVDLLRGGCGVFEQGGRGADNRR